MPQPSAASMGRLLLSKLDRESTEAIVAAVREEVAKEVHEQAVAEAQQHLEDTLRQREEVLEARYARRLATYEADIEVRVQQGIADDVAERERDWEEERTERRARLRERRAQRDAAEQLLVDHWRQLLPEGTRRYLRYYGVETLDLVDLNAALARHGQQVKVKDTRSGQEDLQVRCQVEPGRWVIGTLFWMTRVLPPGVEDTDAPDKSA